MKRRYTSKPEGRLVGDIDVYNAARVKVYLKASTKRAEVLTICASVDVEGEGLCKVVLKFKDERIICFPPLGGAYTVPLCGGKPWDEVNVPDYEEPGISAPK